MMVMIGIIDVALVLLVLLVFFWLVTNVIRYLSHGKDSGWWSLSEKWIKNAEWKDLRKNGMISEKTMKEKIK